MPTIPASQSNSSSAVSYAVWLISQQPRLTQQSVVPSILNRYPELTLGEAQHISTQASVAIQAGIAFGSLLPEQQVSPAAVPIDGSLAGIYRVHAQLELPHVGGGTTIRDLVVESNGPPTQRDIEDRARELTRRYLEDSLPGGGSLGLEYFSLTYVSITRGPGT